LFRVVLVGVGLDYRLDVFLRVAHAANVMLRGLAS
jgi:hypothetical protein